MLDKERHIGRGELKEGEGNSDAGSSGAVMVDSKDFRGRISVTDGFLGDKRGPIGPISPNAKCENGSSHPNPMAPLSTFSAQLPVPDCIKSWKDDDCTDASDESPRTPKECIFDPFAPGPDAMVLAPINRKFGKKFRNIVARRLDFHDSSGRLSGARDLDNEDDVEEMMLESVYKTFLEAILLKQTAVFFAEHYDSHSAAPETPSLPSLLTGIAKTCPRAPLKPGTRRSKQIDNGLCRKLEF
ncbi:hypothetical protein Dimus_006877 [Dionaea muscipula]